MSLKLVPSNSLDAVSYSLSIVTMAISVAVCEIFSVKEWCDLENKVRFVQGHWKWHHSIDRIRVPKLPTCLNSIVTIALSCIVCEI